MCARSVGPLAGGTRALGGETPVGQVPRPVGFPGRTEGAMPSLAAACRACPPTGMRLRPQRHLAGRARHNWTVAAPIPVAAPRTPDGTFRSAVGRPSLDPGPIPAGGPKGRWRSGSSPVAPITSLDCAPSGPVWLQKSDSEAVPGALGQVAGSGGPARAYPKTLGASPAATRMPAKPLAAATTLPS